MEIFFNFPTKLPLFLQPQLYDTDCGLKNLIHKHFLSSSQLLGRPYFLAQVFRKSVIAICQY